MGKVERVLINANVITMDKLKERVEAIAIGDGRIVKIGDNNTVLKIVDEDSQIIDLEGKTVIPGFIETHAHLTDLGFTLSSWINLRNVKSIQEIRDKIKKSVEGTPKGEWVQGFGWDQERLVEKRYPTRFDIDDVSRDNPVVLKRVCEHICVVNTKALEVLGINEDTPPPQGGSFDKDPESGVLTGIFREKAVDLVLEKIPPPSEAILEKAMLEACRKMVSVGITSAHWILGSARELKILRKLRKEGKLKVRVNAILPYEELEEALNHIEKYGSNDEYLRVGTIKVFSDGSLGARTAALKEPYNDCETKGTLIYPPEKLEEIILNVHSKGLQLAIHAIGDEAIELTLKSVEEALRKIPKRGHRHRIEHATVLRRDLIDRIKKANLIVTIQPHFTISDFWIEDRLGKERARLANPYRTLLEAGIMVTGGSDAPVEPVDPLLGIWAAVNRTINSEERLSVEEALKIYTLNGAYASFEEKFKGSIEEGKWADLVILSDDPTRVKPEEIKNLRVLATIVNGVVEYSVQMLKW